MEESKLIFKSNNENSKESKVKLKLKEYFSINKVLIHENFNKFLEFIGLKEIWSTENEQKILWESISTKSRDKNKIDYDSALIGITSFFEEDDDNNINNINIESENNINKSNTKLDESDLNSFDSKKNNENIIDEFLNTLNNNQETLYYIRFINEIFFNKNLNDNQDKNILNNNEEKIKINLDEILEKINKEYKFIKIDNNIFKTYLNYIDDNKSIKHNESKYYYLNKDLINYVNAIIDLKIEENKNNNLYLNSSNINNILISNNISNNINENSVEYNLEKLSLSDNNLVNCINGIISFNTNISFLKLIKKYIENYVLKLRKLIYNEIKCNYLIYQKYFYETNNICQICKNNITKKNRKLNDKIDVISKNNSKLNINLNNDNRISDLNDLMKNDKNLSQSKQRNSVSFSRINSQVSKNMIISNKKALNLPQINTNNLYIVKNETNLNNTKIKNKIISPNNNLSKLNLSLFSNKEGNNHDDINSSKIDVFSTKVNKDEFLLDTTNINIENFENEDIKISNKNNINNNNSNLIKKKNSLAHIKKENKKKNNYKNNIINTNNDKNEINNEDNSDDYDDIGDNIIYNGKVHNTNKYFSKRKLTEVNNDYFINENLNECSRDSDLNLFQSIKSIDNCYNTFAYGPMDAKAIADINRKFNLNDSYINKEINNFYDFKYLAYSHRIKKLFNFNNEKLNVNEFYSEEINAYFSKSNKQKCDLIITSHSFYFLNTDSLECILRINLKQLEFITISSNNFNLLLLSFKGSTDIIIESFQRIQILFFLKKVISKRNLDNQIKISSSNKFCLRKRNGRKDTILTFKNKMFSLTANFENSQKIGVLLKYQENIFSATFTKKLVVLCSIGLVYFNDNFRIPKEIIPIIGTTIKPIIVQSNEKIYCLKIITINDEAYIFGSLKKKEILDWQKEIIHYRKMYKIQMKQINPNYSRKSSKIGDNENEDIFEKD